MISTVTTTSVTHVITNFVTYGGILILVLIAFLGLKEIVDTLRLRRHHYRAFLSLSGIVISALFLVFLSVLVYKVMASP